MPQKTQLWQDSFRSTTDEFISILCPQHQVEQTTCSQPTSLITCATMAITLLPSWDMKTVLTQYRPAHHLLSSSHARGLDESCTGVGKSCTQSETNFMSVTHLNRHFEGRPHDMGHFLSEQGCWRRPCAELAGNVAQQCGLPIQRLGVLHGAFTTVLCLQ